jgi:hypothetical protein
VETDLANGRATTFTVEPLAADRCRVTIATESKVRGGLMGRLEIAFLERLLRPMFAEELFRRAAATVPEDPLARAEALEPRVVIAHALAMQGCRAEAEAELDAIDRIIAENADDPRLAATEDTAALVRLYLEATAP